MRAYVAVVVLCVAGCKSSSGGAGGPADMATSPAITAVATCNDAVVGLRIACDGSQSTDTMGRALSFAWAVTMTPGPAVAATGTGASFSFEPPVAGTYEITLTVSTADGASNFAKAGAQATAVPLFYRQSSLTASTDTFVVSVIGSDGQGAHELDCPTMVADASGNGDGGVANRGKWADTPGTVGTAVRYVEGQEARVAFEEVTASGEHHLLLSDENGDCASRPPLRLDATPAAQHLFPRFSPSGLRIAWIEVGASTQVMTVASDGTTRHLVRANGKVHQDPPLWLDDGRLAWVEDASTNSTPRLQIAAAGDLDGAGDSARTPIVDCDAANDATALNVINQFASVGGAWIVAGGTRSRTANPPGATQLYRLAGTSCSTTAATTLFAQPSGGFAWDFAVSPDGTTLAVSASEAAGAGASDLFLVPADGSVAPSRFIGSSPGFDDVGPAWIAGGKQLTWTQAALDGSATGGGLMVANRDGSGVRSVLPQGGSSTARVFVVAPVNRGLDCSAGGHGAAAAGEALFVLALVVVVRRRHRRRA